MGGKKKRRKIVEEERTSDSKKVRNTKSNKEKMERKNEKETEI